MSMARPLQTSRKVLENRSILRTLLTHFSGRPSTIKKAPRFRKIEQLEDRRVLSGYGPAHIPAVGIQTGYWTNQAAYDNYVAAVGRFQDYSDSHSGPQYPGGYPGSGPGPGYPGTNNGLKAEGLSQPVMVTEQEPNNSSGSGQLVPLNSANPDLTTAIISGSLANDVNTVDVDYYTLNLRGGDILDLSLGAVPAFIPSVALVTSQGNLVAQAFTVPGTGTYPPNSPLTSDGLLAYAAVIPTDGVYQIRVGGGIGSYEITAKVYRNPVEEQPVGTIPELFLDFDGADVDRTEFGFSGSLSGDIYHAPSFAESLAQYGYGPAEINRAIDQIIAKVNEDYNGSIPTLGTNGDYVNDGVPGHFAFRITNSRDDGERFGLPNVTRIVIGGGAVGFFEPTTPADVLGIIGIASSIDVGNFDTSETVMAFAGDFYLLGVPTAFPTAPGTSELDVFTGAISSTISHELGHSIGLWHTDPTDGIDTIMDPFLSLGEGPDGIVGTADDVDLDFVTDRYRVFIDANGFIFPGVPGEFLIGLEQSAAIVSHSLVSGTRGVTIKGTVFSDLNQSGTKQADEFGIGSQIVYADLNGNGVLDAGETRTTTLADGTYTLVAPVGQYKVRVSPTSLFRASNDGVDINGKLDQTINNVNLGLYVPGVGVTGYKWADLNGNGEREANEPGIAGVYIYADLDGDNRPDLSEPGTYTVADGTYFLTVPATGIFAIREVVVPGYIQTFPTNSEKEHLITPATPRPLSGINFGNQPSRDYGDLPAVYGNPSAGIVPGFSLGTKIDREDTGIPTVNATGDDTTGIDDEDGVTLLAPLVVGANNNRVQIIVTNITGVSGYLQGWMDFNGDGDFNDAGEHIITDAIAQTGPYTFSIPAGANVGNVLARFRLSGVKGVGPTADAQIGEVEDYQFQTLSVLRYTNPDSYQAVRNSTAAQNVINVLANDPITSIEGFSASITSVSQGTRGGTITTNGSTVSYKPLPGFVGTEVFTYTVLVSNGVVATETVTVSVDFFFDTPQAIDDSFNVSVNAQNVELDVLGNDARGKGGALIIKPGSVSAPNSGGTATISPNGQRIIYSPAPLFAGTESFTYIATDGTSDSVLATVTIHVLPGDYDNDDVEFSIKYTDLNGNPISQIGQGNSFLVEVYVNDIRPTPGANPGVFAAYLDLLYNSHLVLPGAPSGSFDFNVQFANPYTLLQTGDSKLPGIINELGATASNTTDRTGPIKLATLRFDARTAGIATFFPDPADAVPASDVVLNNDASQAVPEIRTRYVPSSIEVVANPSQFPQAVDDSPIGSIPVNTVRSLDVLANDVVGANGPVRIIRVTQPGSGSVVIDNSGTRDTLRFTSGATQGTFTFTYTIVDSVGFESTATVTVDVGNSTSDDLIKLRLQVTDLAGNPITQIAVGQQFQLRGFVDDLRTGVTQAGVFAAFQDILLSDAALALINPANNPRGFAVQFSSNYPDASSGDIRVPGIINEIGSQQVGPASSSLGDGEFLQFIITLTARQAGALTFTGDPADLVPNSDSLLYDTPAPVDKSRITYTDTTVTIVAGSGTGAGEGFTNQLNSLDVNNDGYVSSIDVLALINQINAGGRGALGGEGEGTGSVAKKYYYDTNKDGYLSSLDILQVINYLNSRSRGEGEGESSSSTQDAALASMSAADFDALAGAAIDVDSIKKAGTRA